MSPKFKLLLPNILTLSRLILTPVIIILGLTKHYNIALIFILIASITDLFDGKLARKWNTTTEFGAKLDGLCDKLFAIGITACLITKNNLFILLLIGEAIIGLFNVFAYYKTKNYETLMIGKIKTAILFTTVAIGFSSLFIKGIDKVIIGLILTTFNIQLLTLLSYIINFYDNSKNHELEEAIVNDKEETRTKIYDIEKIEKNNEEDNEYTSDTKILNHIKDIFLDKE